jgi:uncharacterized membrane protein YvbJ
VLDPLADEKMKQCTQCGKEYPDEVLACAVDQQPLQQVVATSPSQAPLQSKSNGKSDFISLETMLVWAIIAVFIFLIVSFIVVYFLVSFGLARDHGF